jgi:hypothetical protein
LNYVQHERISLRLSANAALAENTFVRFPSRQFTRIAINMHGTGAQVQQ